MFKSLSKLFSKPAPNVIIEEANRLLVIFMTNKQYYSEKIFTPIIDKLSINNKDELNKADWDIGLLVKQANADNTSITVEQRIINLEKYLNYSIDRSMIIQILGIEKMGQFLKSKIDENKI